MGDPATTRRPTFQGSLEVEIGSTPKEVVQPVTDLYGVAPGIDFVEIAQIVDNSGI
jgi:hypothetical protein